MELRGSQAWPPPGEAGHKHLRSCQNADRRAFCCPVNHPPPSLMASSLTGLSSSAELLPREGGREGGSPCRAFPACSRAWPGAGCELAGSSADKLLEAEASWAP